ncbi:MAG: hypothetical protein KUG75_05160 [Pseudomonadales bacterium]|nr:hypothetical protein [Pseudomonadales bacterium]
MYRLLSICIALVLSTSMLAETLSSSVGLMIYPSDGQSADKLAEDDYQCYAWAKGETKYDPINPEAPAEVVAANPGPDGSGVRGAVRGAAAGAIIGEVVDGDAGDGAKIGAAAGIVRGRGRARRKARQQAEQTNQKNDSAFAEKQGKFKSAMSLCMESRGYAVK